MTLPARYRDPQLAERLAADWLTGGMGATAQRRAFRLAEQSPEFAAAVVRWRTRLDAALLGSNVYGLPEDRVWEKIEGRLGGQQVHRGPSIQERKLRFWRWLGITASSLVLLFLVLRVNPLLFPTEPLPGAMADAAALLEGEAVAAIVVVHDSQLRFIPVGNLTVPPDKSPELWLMPREGAPIPIGIIQAGRTTYPLHAPVIQRLRELKGFAVSIEPVGGSPTGLPTGPVIMMGNARSARS